MGQLTTHVLDTAHGCPAAGMGVTLLRVSGDAMQTLAEITLNTDGRNGSGPLLSGDALQVGHYRLVFSVAAYFRAKGVALPDPPFLGEVVIDFGVADAKSHYHVPLLVSPWAYSTYRGS
jgi:5-hydroxyisourate hydrolase